MSGPLTDRLTRGSVEGPSRLVGLAFLAVAVGLMGAGTAGTARHAELVVAASVAAGVLLVLTVARYAGVVAFGFLIFGVVFSQPALPDLVFGMIILVAVLTGGERWTFRRAPPVVVYILGAFFVINVVAAAWARSLPQAALFITITGYLIAFGLWLTAYVDSDDSGRGA